MADEDSSRGDDGPAGGAAAAGDPVALHAARLRSILDTAPDAIILIDERGRIESFSRAAERLFGYHAREVVGRNVAILMPHPYREAHDGYLERYRRTGERHIIGTGRLAKARRKDGGIFPIELSVGEVEIDGTRLFTGFIRDLTARRRMEQELRQAQKMEAVGQLTGGVAHDFNNLLTVILGNLEMLEMRVADARQQDLVREAREAAELGAQLTERLLAFGRRQQLKPRPIAPRALLEDLAPLLRRTLGETIEVAIRAASDLRRTLVDPGQLQNALINLALNARDAMPGGGRLLIEARCVDTRADDGRADPEVGQGCWVLLSVADTGTGMSRAVAERAFEPFFTTKEVGAGTGLGLSMVYGFVRQSQGHAVIDSTPGRGTTVHMYLPCADEAPEEDAPATAALGAYRASGETILVVEDQPRVRRLAVARLRELGYAVLEAPNGPAALECLADPAPIDLVLTDVVMPGGMTGDELAVRARALRPGVKVVLTSGFAEPAALRDGAADAGVFLKKPYTAFELGRVLRRTLAGSEPSPRSPRP
ncbi:PAS domain S-box protein [Salinarimonas rosea]|uniref:PAS domain S-box protein n=1 Tax=Salinarimonas rosea TaxID=552063 RepID=UPI001FD9BBB0|nr:PAS domain S-box protein [Salinarimonas rosea]